MSVWASALGLALLALAFVLWRMSAVSRRAKRQRIDAARDALCVKKFDRQLSQHVVTFLAELDPSQHRAAFAQWRRIARGVAVAEAAFGQEGLESFLSQAARSQLECAVDAARLLGLDAIVGPMVEAMEWVGWEARNLAAFDGDKEHPLYADYTRYLAGIQRRFDGLGGVELLQDAAMAYFQQELPTILKAELAR